MAKKLITCEILTTVKGLESKDPQTYTYPGSADKPTLVNLPDNSDTADLVKANVVRIWPGPVVPPVPESVRLKELQDENDQLQTAFKAAAADAENATAVLRNILDLTDIDEVKAAVNEALK